MNTPETAVLLVEANDGHARFIQDALEQIGGGHDVRRVVTIQDALAALDSHTFDVALAALTLPDSHGMDTVATLRGRQPHLPLVVLGSRWDDGVALAAIDHGAQDYLVTDAITPEGLRRGLCHAVRRQHNVMESERLLSELNLAKAQLEKKNRRLRKMCRAANRFVDNVSHEFRTPLTVIKEYGSLLRDGLLGDVNDEQQRFLDVVNDRSDDLNRMVDDMLDVSKLGAGILGIRRGNFQIADILQRVQPALDRKAALKNIDFQVQIDGDFSDAYVDAEKVGRVIINLVVNAFKFRGEPGLVRVAVTEPIPGQELQISVSDNGPGIRPTDLRKIFRRFKQVGAGSRSSAKGFGLGLSVARELVQLNLGAMRVRSELGAGSVFSFTLPAANPRHVIRRYLASPRRRHSPRICLATLKTDAEHVDGPREETEAFLGGLLRRDDLLFSVGAGWQVVLAGAQADLDTFRRRLNQARDRANRNRPREPLPAISLERQGCWKIPDETQSFLRHFDLSQRAEAIHG